MKTLPTLSALPLLFAASAALAQAPVSATAAPAAAPAAAAAPAVAPAPTAAAEAAPTPAAAVAPSAEAAPAAPASTAAAVPVQLDASGDVPAPAPEKLAVSKSGFFQPSANLQAWFIAEHLGNNRVAADDAKGIKGDAWASSFRIRRAELRAKGEIIPKTIGYTVMFDPARLLDLQPATTSTSVVNADGTVTTTSKTTVNAPAQGGSGALTGAASSILQDVQLTYMTDYADFSIGQFKIPVSLEGYGSASKLLFPERSLISRKYGDRRDLGFKVEKKLEYFSYWLGVYNGQGQNNLDTNDQKDLTLRVEAFPIKDLTLGLMGYASVGDRTLVGTKDRIEGDIKFERSGFLLQAEAIRGWDRVAAPTMADPKATLKQEGQGFYVAVGYTLFGSLQPVVRIGSVDPWVGHDETGPYTGDPKTLDPNDELTAYELVLNYYLKKHDAKLQLSGSFFDPEQHGSHTTFDLILASQVAF